MINLREVKFYKSVWFWNNELFFDEKKEIIFVGRSNVGKSSLMNNLFQKKDLVKTSARPWKTKLVNIFEVENKYYLTDLPGYWFAKLWKELKKKLDWLIIWYIEERKENIKKVSNLGRFEIMTTTNRYWYVHILIWTWNTSCNSSFKNW